MDVDTPAVYTTHYDPNPRNIMKFHKSDIEVLENFATINSNMLFREGKEIRTISPAKNVFAVANIEQDIPQKFAIFDLSNFLSVLSIGEGDLTFSDTHVEISTLGGNIDYYFSNPELILAAPEKNIVVDKEFSFDLLKEDVSQLYKIGSLLSAPHLSITCKKGKVTLALADRKNSSSNSFKKIVGEHDGDFDVYVSFDTIKVLARNYVVSVSKKKVLHFESANVQYWVSVDANSKI